MAWHLYVDWCASNDTQYHAAHPIRGEITDAHALFALFKCAFSCKPL